MTESQGSGETLLWVDAILTGHGYDSTEEVARMERLVPLAFSCSLST